ncbi:hypothetical protein [Actinophytocola glycyrrhizae]|uniref:Uncharacterized protein n=1 Tax=Actinophytocola glycyrrhizae TaxID=2044873 RepID=A0ABV9RZ56_9PSEU
MAITTSRSRVVGRTSMTVLVAAWTVPVLVAAQFALIAGIPIAIALAGSLRDPRLRAARWWSGAIAAVYAAALASWAVGPGNAPSLSKSMSPVATALFAAAGVAVAVAHQVVRRRSSVAE